MNNYKKLKEFCNTNRQQAVLALLAENSSMTKTAKEMNISRQGVQNIVKAVKHHGRKRGYDPDHDMTHPGPEGMALKRLSTNYDKDGEINQQWVIFEPGKEHQEQMFRDFCQGLSDEIAPQKKIKKPKGKFKSELLSAVVIGDGHLGSLAHKEDNLVEDFNIDIATKDLCAAIDYLVDQAPLAEEGMLVNVGDFIHVDGASNTTTGGTPQDTSVRHPRMLRIAGATLRYCINRMAEKFPRVTVVNAAGNHDATSALALSMFLEGLYEKDPRVTIEPTESKFFFREFGKNLIGITHGDRIPANRLTGVMTRLAAEQWGRTQWRRWWVGHIHHKQKLAMDAGCTIESFNTLAGTDAWHSASGYGGERGIELITLHKEFGEIGRLSPSLEMVRAYAE